MGTSISQPSPSGSEPGSPEWKEVQDAVGEGEPADRLLRRVFDAFHAQYEAALLSKVIDPGVRIIGDLVQSLGATSKPITEMELAKFSLDAKRLLSQSKQNSFFAEIAIVAGAKALLADRNVRTFAVEYVASIVNYSLSRDLPYTIGRPGLANLTSLDRRLTEVRSSLIEMASRIGAGSAAELIERLVTAAASQRSR